MHNRALRWQNHEPKNHADDTAWVIVASATDECWLPTKSFKMHTGALQCESHELATVVSFELIKIEQRPTFLETKQKKKAEINHKEQSKVSIVDIQRVREPSINNKSQYFEIPHTSPPSTKSCSIAKLFGASSTSVG